MCGLNWQKKTQHLSWLLICWTLCNAADEVLPTLCLDIECASAQITSLCYCTSVNHCTRVFKGVSWVLLFRQMNGKRVWDTQARQPLYNMLGFYEMFYTPSNIKHTQTTSAYKLNESLQNSCLNLNIKAIFCVLSLYLWMIDSFTWHDLQLDLMSLSSDKWPRWCLFSRPEVYLQLLITLHRHGQQMLCSLSCCSSSWLLVLFTDSSEVRDWTGTAVFIQRRISFSSAPVCASGRELL